MSFKSDATYYFHITKNGECRAALSVLNLTFRVKGAFSKNCLLLLCCLFLLEVGNEFCLKVSGHEFVACKLHDEGGTSAGERA